MHDLSALNVNTIVAGHEGEEDNLPLPTQHPTSYLAMAQVVSQAGSIFTRAVTHAMSVVHSFSDFYDETVVDAMTITSDPGTGPVDRNRSVTDAMSIAHDWTKTGVGGLGVTYPEATFDSNTSKGMAIHVSGADNVDLANADDPTTAICFGIAREDVTAGNTGEYQSEGQLSVTDWTPVIGSANLTPGVVYYLDTSDGQMTSTPPTGAGNHIVRIGIATNTTTLELEIARPILLAI
jgi:hypothetical protein